MPEDLALLERWDEEPDVVASGGEPEANDWNWAVELTRSPAWREQLIALEDGRPIGVVQIIDPQLEDSHYWGDCGPNLRAIDIWLGDEKDRGRGLGAEVMRQAIARCFAAPNVTAIYLDPLVSNVRAIAFYERLGFEFVGERWFGPDHCHVMRLARRESD